jgi:hypothetical protein
VWSHTFVLPGAGSGLGFASFVFEVVEKAHFGDFCVERYGDAILSEGFAIHSK